MPPPKSWADMACTNCRQCAMKALRWRSAGYSCTSSMKRARRTVSTPATSKPAINVSPFAVVFGHDVVAARKVRTQEPYDHGDIRSDILDTAEDDRLRVDYGRFHETVRD